jgi:hypothetical protein
MMKRSTNFNPGELNIEFSIFLLTHVDATSAVPQEVYGPPIQRFGKFSEERFGKFSEDRFGENLQVKIMIRYMCDIKANKAKICYNDESYFVTEVSHDSKRFTYLKCNKGG